MTALAQIVAFLNGIGLQTGEGMVPETSFLPGVRVARGTLVYDPARLTWPGDLLHEAGHLATVPASLRSTLSDGIDVPAGVDYATEVEATAWAYAALVHLQLDPAVLFHGGGYQGASDQLILMFSLGVYPGAFGLAQAGMTTIGDTASVGDAARYPRMSRWLRA